MPYGTCIPSAFDGHVTFDLLTSGSVHAEVLRWSIFMPSLVMIAQVVFLLECTHTDRQTVTDSTNHRTHASATGVHNNDGTSS